MAYFLSPALVRLRTEINALWPHRDKTSDGWIGDASHKARPSDHNPDWSDGGIVRAIDIDEDLTVGLGEVGAAMPLVNAILRDPRVRYVIYEGRIWNVDTQRWSPYSGPNAHRHHVHVSVRKTGSYDRDASPWNLAATIGRDIGSIPTVSIPSFPGAPAPITPEDYLMSTEAQERLARIERIVTQNQRDIRATPGRVWNATLGRGENKRTIAAVLAGIPAAVANIAVRRNGQNVPWIQDTANGTTAAQASDARTAALAEVVRQLAAQNGTPVDYDRIDQIVRDAVASGIDVTVSVDVPTTDDVEVTTAPEG